MKTEKKSISKNHEKAPLCSSFVKAFREVFGPDQIKVLYVKENEIEMGRPAFSDEDLAKMGAHRTTTDA